MAILEKIHNVHFQKINHCNPSFPHCIKPNLHVTGCRFAAFHHEQGLTLIAQKLSKLKSFKKKTHLTKNKES